MSQGKLRVEQTGAVGWMLFDNPERRNAINGDMWRAIPEAMRRFDADAEIRCVVLRGVGELAFAAGADISEFEKRRASEKGTREYEGVVDAAQESIEASIKPVVALVHGFCIGGGVEIALACDLRYASEASTFAVPAARLGIGYGVHGMNRLVKTVGHASAREIMLTGRRFNSAEALAMGLVNRVLPSTEVDAYVAKLTQELAANAPLSMAASKAVINIVIEAHGDYGAGDAAIARCMNSEDYIEGRRAFMDKRIANFKGK
ncbi:MAG: enoyl-CoA hydratase [Betaproteobacteria bacterium]